MISDREWEIFELEVEARHLAMIAEFLESKMRPRDLEALASPESLPEEEQEV